MPITLRVSLVVDSWRGPKAAPLSAEDELHLSTGDLHAGSTFPGTITLDPDTASELWTALQDGYQPVFWMARSGRDVVSEHARALLDHIAAQEQEIARLRAEVERLRLALSRPAHDASGNYLDAV